MNKTRKILSIFLVLLIMTSIISGCSTDKTVGGTSEGKYSDGKYQGKASGHNGDIHVEVTIQDGDIHLVEVLDNKETEVLSAAAFDKIITAVMNEKSINIDTVSGATITSLGLINAIKDALLEAGGSEEIFKADERIIFQSKADVLEETYDVVIVGAGGAGLSAAVEAQGRGAKVVVLEKMNAIGGNTLVSGGGLNVPNSPQQKNNKVEDSVEKFIEDTLKGGDNINDKALVEIMAKNALPTTEWLVEEIGVEFMTDRLQQFGGHSVARALISKDNHGTELIVKLKEKADELGVAFKMATKAEELIMDEDGRAIAVKATNDAGQTLTFYGNKGIVLATGGFGANIEMRKEYNSEYNEKYKTTDVPATTGDGILMAEAVGSNLIDMEYIQTYPLCNPRTGIISYVANSRFDGAILVNQEGKRFVDEMGRRDEISKEILDQTNGYAYLVWGKEIEEVGNMTTLHENEYDNLEKHGLIHKNDNIEELAMYFDIDRSVFKETIKDYNAFVEEKKDIEIKRAGTLRSIKEGDYYIQKVVPAVHHTMGGIQIDTEARVLDKIGQPIKGLFAAGEVTGGIHGTNRLGGNAVTDVIVFGKIAGENVVK